MMGRRAFERLSSSILRRRRCVRSALLLGGSISYAAVLFLASGKGNLYNVDAAYINYSLTSVTSCEKQRPVDLSLSAAADDTACDNVRTRKTSADVYFEKHKSIPKPKVMHETLEPNDNSGSTERRGVLVIGDVHGCYEEMILLHQAAVTKNGGIPFRYVILVGDLCQKGPDSSKVVKYVREQPNWLAVRGNHDNAVLAAALGDAVRSKKKKYKWAHTLLSDKDVLWLSELPYTITIPASLLALDSESSDDLVDTTIVHAGLVPGIDLEKQSISTMVTIREVDPIYDGDEADKPTRYVHHGTEVVSSNAVRGERVPWASVWQGPNRRIIFGHDARRGLQLFDSKWACGLDTGAVYGKQLTGIILPQRQLVQVDALKVHSPVG